MKVLGNLSVEQKKSGGQSVKLNRIVVPAHLKVVPLTDAETVDPPVAPPANSKAAPAGDPRFDKTPEVEEANPVFRRMIIAASVLAAAIAVLLYINARNPGATPEPFATIAPTNPEVIEAALEATLTPPPATAGPEQETPPAAQATIVSVLPQPRPVLEPVLTAEIENPAEAEPVVIAPPDLAEPPAAETPRATDITQAPTAEEPAVPVDMIQLVTTGTLEALRSGGSSEAETAIHRFVLSLQGRNRPNAEIAQMLQRAHDAGTLPVPAQYLRGGKIDIDAIVLAMQSTR